MSESTQRVVHVYRLEASSKLLLAAIAIALAANLVFPFLGARESLAQLGANLRLYTLTCKGELPQHGSEMVLKCAGAQL